jgi:hypothetical protein
MLKEVQELTEAASRLLYSALDAFRKGGLLNVSDEMLDYFSQPWRSPWLDSAEAQTLRAAADSRGQAMTP